VLAAVQQDGDAFHHAAAPLSADREIVLAAVQQNSRTAGRPARLRAFLKYALDLREANIKAKVDLWLTCHELHDWVEAAGIVFKRRKRARLDELGD
jgi:transposase